MLKGQANQNFQFSTEIIRLQNRIELLEKLVRILLLISRENEDFGPYTTKEEQQLAADFYDAGR